MSSEPNLLDRGAVKSLGRLSILIAMKKIFKKLNKEFLLGFIPLSVLSIYYGGIKTTTILSTLLGVAYIVWQVTRR